MPGHALGVIKKGTGTQGLSPATASLVRQLAVEMRPECGNSLLSLVCSGTFLEQDLPSKDRASPSGQMIPTSGSPRSLLRSA